LECFGANLSDITEEVFGTNEISKHYQHIIRGLKNQDKNEEQIIQLIQSDDIPVSLGLRLFIKSLFAVNQ
jgi:hypothetical protein